MNQLTPAERERLVLLMEECAEVIQIASKVLRHGYESHHPHGGPTNRAELEKEMGDVRYSMIMLCVAGDTNKSQIHQYAYDKAQSVQQYLHFQPKEFLQDVEEECQP